MAKAVEIKNVTINGNEYLVSYITGTERKYPEDKLPKTVKTWLANHEVKEVGIQEFIKTPENESETMETASTTETVLPHYKRQTGDMFWNAETVILAVFYGIFIAAAITIKVVAKLVGFIPVILQKLEDFTDEYQPEIQTVKEVIERVINKANEIIGYTRETAYFVVTIGKSYITTI